MADLSPEERLELFQRAQAQFTDRVDAVGPDQWGEQALPDWTVADLVAHLVSEQLWVPALLAGEPADGDRVPTDTAELLGDDPLSAWESASDEALSAFAAGDALRRTVQLSRGPTPVGDYVLEMTVDLTVHTWDLARATGGDVRLDPELVQVGLRYAERLPADGVPGIFAPPVAVADGAPAQVQLLARLGRSG